MFCVGALHLSQIPGMIAAPKLLRWKEELQKISPINRYIFVVLIGGIIISMLGSGVVVMVNSREVINGSKFSASFTCYLALLWSYRFFIQAAVYTRLWPRDKMGVTSHLGLIVLFGFQTVAYWGAFGFNLMKLFSTRN